MYFSCLVLIREAPGPPGHPCILLKWGMTQAPAIFSLEGLGVSWAGSSYSSEQQNRAPVSTFPLPLLPSPPSPLTEVPSLEQWEEWFHGSVHCGESTFPATTKRKGRDGWTAHHPPGRAERKSYSCSSLPTSLLCVLSGSRLESFCCLGNLFERTYFPYVWPYSLGIEQNKASHVRRLLCPRPFSGLMLKQPSLEDFQSTQVSAHAHARTHTHAHVHMHACKQKRVTYMAGYMGGMARIGFEMFPV